MAAAESLLYKKRKTTHKHVPVVNKVPGTWLPRTYQDKSIGLPCTSTGNDIVLTSPQNNDQYQVHYFLLSWIIARPHKNSTPSVPGTRYYVCVLIKPNAEQSVSNKGFVTRDICRHRNSHRYTSLCR